MERFAIHVAIAAISLIALFRSGAWRQAGRLHTTVLYMIIGNLLYLFLTSGYLLWAFVPDLQIIPAITELIYTFIVFPCTVIQFLADFPESKKEQLQRYIKWVCIYALTEAIYVWSVRIVYAHGWGWWWSVGFDLMMFPMLYLHSRKPGTAYVVSVFIIIALLLMFRVPLWKVPMYSV